MDLRDLNSAPLQKAALYYAERGWPVLPLRAGQKTPLTKHGLLEASTDPAAIRQWWKKWPKANIGLRTGVAFDVLDVDGPAGRDNLRALLTAYGLEGYIHSGPVSTTGKGYHALFQVTGARNAANKMPGLDFRGQNGYIVAAPSLHPLGHRYQWHRDGEPPEPPSWLYHIVKPKATSDFSGTPPENMTPIVRVWQSYFEKDHPLEASGSRYKTNCPWHDDSTPSFYLFPENNSFYCFGCGEWGDSQNLLDSVDSEYISPSEFRASR